MGMEDIKFIQTSLSQKEIQLHLTAETQDITLIYKLRENKMWMLYKIFKNTK
jgi:hypothetical protein